mmetsp:Transcript_13768/g.29643  ORF Transcript_13768/g.29643 Transcript_13768/m.29643 type:complete len:245 (+) Transcript_13768:556-1290(+)
MQNLNDCMPTTPTWVYFSNTLSSCTAHLPSLGSRSSSCKSTTTGARARRTSRLYARASCTLALNTGTTLPLVEYERSAHSLCSWGLSTLTSSSALRPAACTALSRSTYSGMRCGRLKYCRAREICGCPGISCLSNLLMRQGLSFSQEVPAGSCPPVTSTLISRSRAPVRLSRSCSRLIRSRSKSSLLLGVRNVNFSSARFTGLSLKCICSLISLSRRLTWWMTWMWLRSTGMCSACSLAVRVAQ